ncbi:MAG: tRNA methyltransferase [Bacteroidetes bacterium]|nr:MAG: tRNA methyltransferase [Bacteroidota bacterium]PTM17338.1 MAG: tRNA methyltransferase [Bacteroidota bacterium]PTM17690.1 MAG: tRNA methyltransferase [Bacteroidota bacterium]
MNYTKPFKMKEFEVAHDQCAMRVNTDGCLLGALAASNTAVDSVHRVLDIGTGSGVIALQLAQRFQKAFVDGIEIHGPSAKQAMDNFRNSPFHSRMVCYHQPIQEFEMNTYYDIIVSNPPYFEEGPTKSDHGVAAARHALTLDFKSLVMSVSGLLKPQGSFWAILPCDRKDRFLDAALDEGLYLNEVIHIKPKENREANRCIFGLSRNNTGDAHHRAITIYSADQSYTTETHDVLSPFYDSL